jgi:hypothetical protein
VGRSCLLSRLDSSRLVFPSLLFVSLFSTKELRPAPVFHLDSAGIHHDSRTFLFSTFSLCRPYVPILYILYVCILYFHVFGGIFSCFLIALLILSLSVFYSFFLLYSIRT